ncbi:MAG TPA: lysophospholipid acyltransferase family protein [Candidatus Dormibacteraeota bacterium]|jgi:1-acyl-sn-glycerol-3-phosphate acyltransferase|nr:lysophospholipid acyltransferase family protein [Candidatus Dormibacteraeota bacterium]
MRDRPWYSGELGPARLAHTTGVLISDLRQLQAGFRWDRPRPWQWPEAESGLADGPTDLGWARTEPVRTIRLLIQRGLSGPFTRAMAHPKVEGAEWITGLDRPAILASNHSSHADTSLLLYALPDRARERTVVAAAADYWYRRPFLGRVISLWLNTFPFSRTGGASEVLHRSSQLLKGGWNLLVYPEGSRSPDGRLQAFKPGVGHLATQTRSPVVPMHVRGSRRLMPRGRSIPLPAPVTIKIGKPLYPGRGEGSREFTVRVEEAVRDLAGGKEQGDWIARWRAGAPYRRLTEGDLRTGFGPASAPPS